MLRLRVEDKNPQLNRELAVYMEEIKRTKGISRCSGVVSDRRMGESGESGLFLRTGRKNQRGRGRICDYRCGRLQ